MAQDPRPFVDRNAGNPTNKIMQQTVTKISSNKTVQNFTIPKNMGPANNPKRK